MRPRATKARSSRRESSPSAPAKKIDKFRLVDFFIQSEGLVCNLTAGEYVIAEGVWHHASACILLRIDYIQHFVLIPYRSQAADFIHAYRRDYIESCVEVLDFGGTFRVFRDNPPFHHCTFPRLFGFEPAIYQRAVDFSFLIGRCTNIFTHDIIYSRYRFTNKGERLCLLVRL